MCNPSTFGPLPAPVPFRAYQMEKQQAELRAKREEAWARRRALGLVVEGGAEGSRPLFDDRPTPKVCAVQAISCV